MGIIKKIYALALFSNFDELLLFIGDNMAFETWHFSCFTMFFFNHKFALSYFLVFYFCPAGIFFFSFWILPFVTLHIARFVYFKKTTLSSWLPGCCGREVTRRLAGRQLPASTLHELHGGQFDLECMLAVRLCSFKVASVGIDLLEVLKVTTGKKKNSVQSNE